MTILLTATIIEFRSFIRQPVSMFWTFVYPVMLMLILSFMFGSPSNTEIRALVSSPVVLEHNQVSKAEEILDDVGVSLILSLMEERVNDEDYHLYLDMSSDGSINIIPFSSSGEARLVALALQTSATGNDIQINFPGNEGPPNYNLYLVSGVVALSVISMGLFGFTPVLVANRAAGRLKWLGYWPLGSTKYLIAFTLSRTIIIVLFSIVFLYVFGWIYGAENIWSIQMIMSFLIVLISGSVCFLSLGLLLASILTKPQTAAAVSNLLNLPILFLSDLVIPLSILPDYIASIARHSPVYHFVAMLRDMFENGAMITDSRYLLVSIILLIFGILIFRLSGNLFVVTPEST